MPTCPAQHEESEGTESTCPVQHGNGKEEAQGKVLLRRRCVTRLHKCCLIFHRLSPVWVAALLLVMT